MNDLLENIIQKIDISADDTTLDSDTASCSSLDQLKYVADLEVDPE